MKKTKEDKATEKIVEIVSDITLDLDEVGKKMSRIRPNTIYNRFMVVAEATQYYKEEDKGSILDKMSEG